MEFAKQYLEQLYAGLAKISLKEVQQIADVLFQAYEDNRQVFILGNGGSASLASHFACDLSKGTLSNVYDLEERRFRVISLTDNMSLFSALANDLGYDHVFVQQLRNLLMPGDLVIGISGSGNSPNVVEAFRFAKSRGAITIGFVGFDGGKLKSLSDYAIHFDEKNYQRSEDAHMIFAHLISTYLAERKRKKGKSRSQRALVKPKIVRTTILS